MKIAKKIKELATKAAVEAAWLLRRQGPAPPSLPSKESLLHIPEDLREFDYSVYLEGGGTPHRLESHIGDAHEESGQFTKACPWCNPYFFDWLRIHQQSDFIEQIPTEHTVLAPSESGSEIATTSTTVHQAPLGPGFQRFCAKEAKSKGWSDEHKRARNMRWVEKSAENVIDIQSNSVTESAEGAEQIKFNKLPKNQKAVQSWVRKKCTYEPKELESYPTKNNLFVTPSPDYPTEPGAPKYLLMRFDDIVTLDTQKLLWYHWCEVRDLLKTSEHSKHRDDLPAAHFGIWQHYANCPYVTSDTLKQTKEAQKHVKAFLKVLTDEVARKLWNLLRRYDPETLDRQVKLCNQLRKNQAFMDTMNKMPHIDFGGIFFACAVKEGGSQKVHLDWMDHMGTYAWVICIGPGWTGGELCLPQLGRKVPTKSGQVIAFRARYLAHFAAPSTGSRLVITGFTDRFIMNSALKAEEGTDAPPQAKKARLKS